MAKNVNRYKVMDAKCDFSNRISTGYVVGEIKLTDDNGDTVYMSITNTDEYTFWFKTRDSKFDRLTDPDSFDEEFTSYMDRHALDYDTPAEALADQDSQWHDAVRYLFYLVESDDNDAVSFIQKSTGKYLDEIEIPETDWEKMWVDDDEESELPEGLRLVFPEDKDLLFRLCLAYSAEHEAESIFKDMSPDDVAVNEYVLEKALELINADEYRAWKKAYLDTEYEKLKGRHFLVVSYQFAGIGGYDDVIPEEQFDSFICWINGNGSAFFTGKADAEEDDVRFYIARHAYDGCPPVVDYEQQGQ